MHPLLTEAIARDHQARLAQDATPRHVRPIRPTRRGLRHLAQALAGALRLRQVAPPRLATGTGATPAEGPSCC